MTKSKLSGLAAPIAMLDTSTLRPGLLVSLKTSITGNVKYRTTSLEAEHTTDSGEARAKWETERTVSNRAEQEAAVKARSRVRALITGVCSASAFGLLCPEDKAENLAKAMSEARKIASEFNSTAELTRLSVNMLCGRIAADDVEAVKAINSEIADLMLIMNDGIKTLDVKAVRDAATKVKSMGNMLTGEAQARVQIAVDLARATATKMVAAGEQAAQEIDKATLKRIAEQRTAFLDLDEQQQVAKPKGKARALDLAPSGSVKPSTTSRPRGRALEL